MMAIKKRDHETRILAALKALSDDPDLSLRRVARMYDVPRSTLNDRRLGKTKERSKAHPDDQLLSTEEEEVLVGWIEDWDDRGLPPRRRHVLGMVGSILRDRGSTDRIGKRWLDRFLQRHTELDSKVGKTIDKQRALATNQAGFDKHLNRFQQTKSRYRVEDSDTWNTDEKGFAIGLSLGGTVICRSSRRNPHLIQDGNRSWVTVVESISAAGVPLPPFVIYPAAGHYLGHHEDIEYEESDDVTFGLSQSGYTDRELSIDWLIQHFEPRTRPAGGIQKHRILLLDGHSSHLENFEFIDFAIKHNIHIICLPSHATHILQPLDVGIFSPLRQYYGQEIEDFMRANGPYSSVGKGDFYPMLGRARQKTFTAQNIKSAWRATGLVPFNRRRVTMDPNLQQNIQPLEVAKTRPGLRPLPQAPTRATVIDQLQKKAEETRDVGLLKGTCAELVSIANTAKTEAAVAKESLEQQRGRRPGKSDRRRIPGGRTLGSRELARLIRKRKAADEEKSRKREERVTNKRKGGPSEASNITKKVKRGISRQGKPLVPTIVGTTHIPKKPNKVYLSPEVLYVLAKILQVSPRLATVSGNTQGRPKRAATRNINYALLNSPKIE